MAFRSPSYNLAFDNFSSISMPFVFGSVWIKRAMTDCVKNFWVRSTANNTCLSRMRHSKMMTVSANSIICTSGALDVNSIENFVGFGMIISRMTVQLLQWREKFCSPRNISILWTLSSRNKNPLLLSWKSSDLIPFFLWSLIVDLFHTFVNTGTRQEVMHGIKPFLWLQIFDEQLFFLSIILVAENRRLCLHHHLLLRMSHHRRRTYVMSYPLSTVIGMLNL